MNRKVTFWILALVSLFLISSLDRTIFQWLTTHQPSLAILADLRLTSLSVIVCIYFFVRRHVHNDSIASAADKKRAYVLSALWLLSTAYFALVVRGWLPALNDWIDYVAFIGTGLVGEEILFRGALYDLAVKNFGTQKFLRFSKPVWITAILFGVQHLGYHHYQLTSESIGQVINTILMGVFFGNLREATGRLWPVILLHSLTNSFTVFRNLGWL